MREEKERLQNLKKKECRIYKLLKQEVKQKYGLTGTVKTYSTGKTPDQEDGINISFIQQGKNIPEIIPFPYKNINTLGKKELSKFVNEADSVMNMLTQVVSYLGACNGYVYDYILKSPDDSEDGIDVIFHKIGNKHPTMIFMTYEQVASTLFLMNMEKSIPSRHEINRLKETKKHYTIT